MPVSGAITTKLGPALRWEVGQRVDMKSKLCPTFVQGLDWNSILLFKFPYCFHHLLLGVESYCEDEYVG